MDDRILTLHPEGKEGVNILRSKYELVKEHMIDIIALNGEISFMELNQALEQRLKDKLDGSISWYVTTIKLDLEARNIVKRIPKRRPQMLVLVGK